jgi:hypothetical protein
VQVPGLVDEARHFAGRLGDVDQQHMPTTGTFSSGMRASSSCPGPGGVPAPAGALVWTVGIGGPRGRPIAQTGPVGESCVQ